MPSPAIPYPPDNNYTQRTCPSLYNVCIISVWRLHLFWSLDIMESIYVFPFYRLPSSYWLLSAKSHRTVTSFSLFCLCFLLSTFPNLWIACFHPFHPLSDATLSYAHPYPIQTHYANVSFFLCVLFVSSGTVFLHIASFLWLAALEEEIIRTPAAPDLMNSLFVLQPSLFTCFCLSSVKNHFSRPSFHNAR